MSEERQEAGGGEQAPAPAPEESGSAPPVPSAIPLGGGGDDDAGDATPSWREDWREAFSGGDEKMLRDLKRFATPEAFAKSGWTARERVLSGKTASFEPPEGASDIELTQWRKQVGIPEAPEGYGIAFPTEMKPSEKDKAELGSFLQFMHERHVPPGAAKAAFDFYMNSRAEGIERMQEAVDEEISRNVADLRSTFPGKKYGEQFGKNGDGGLVNEFLKEHWPGPDGEKVRNEIVNARTSSGVPLAIYAPFLKGLANMAAQANPWVQVLGGDSGAGGESLQQEYDKLAALPRRTNEQYQRMVQIQEAKIARENRQGRTRAA